MESTVAVGMGATVTRDAFHHACRLLHLAYIISGILGLHYVHALVETTVNSAIPLNRLLDRQSSSCTPPTPFSRFHDL
jgi:hypothetical protein